MNWLARVKMTLFSQSEICSATGFKPEVLRVRRSRGLFDLGAGRGHKKYTFTEAYQTAVMQALEMIGLSVNQAYDFAIGEELEKVLQELHQQILNAKTVNTLLVLGKSKTYICIRRHFEDGKLPTTMIIRSSGQLGHIDAAFPPVTTSTIPQNMPVASICFIQIEAIVAECFSRLEALHDDRPTLQTSAVE